MGTSGGGETRVRTHRGVREGGMVVGARRRAAGSGGGGRAGGEGKVCGVCKTDWGGGLASIRGALAEAGGGAEVSMGQRPARFRGDSGRSVVEARRGSVGGGSVRLRKQYAECGGKCGAGGVSSG